MLSLTSWHNWVAFGLLLLVWGWLFHQLANRFAPAAGIVHAAFGS